MKPSPPDKDAVILTVVSLSSRDNPASCQGLGLTQLTSKQRSFQIQINSGSLAMEERASDLKSAVRP